VGSIGEIAGAEQPFTSRGCIAQAWSVAETLRSWVNTAEERGRKGGHFH
jgi:glycogen debranching enzyme